MKRVLVSVHHGRRHSGVVIGDAGPAVVSDLRAVGSAGAPIRGDGPALVPQHDGSALIGGLMPRGAVAAEAVVDGRRVSAVVRGGAWIAVLEPGWPPGPIPMRFTDADGVAVAVA